LRFGVLLLLGQWLEIPFHVEVEDWPIQVVEVPAARRRDRRRIGTPLFTSFRQSEDIHVPFFFSKHVVERVARAGGPRRPTLRFSPFGLASDSIAGCEFTRCRLAHGASRTGWRLDWHFHAGCRRRCWFGLRLRWDFQP
jgi:hypothetical protein